MALYVYNAATGALVSWCPNDTDPVAPASVLQAQGLASVSGLPALDTTHQWSAASKTVVTVAAPAPTISSYAFILLFTAAEAAAVRASTDQSVQQWLLALQTSPTLNLGDATVTNGVNYLASVNLITSTRAAQILSNTAPS